MVLFHQNATEYFGIARTGDATGARPFLQRPKASADPGRAYRTNAPGMERAFRTPTLRDLAVRGPFMHDGSIATLEEVVRHYADGAGADPIRDERVRGFESTIEERADLVAFLESLRSVRRPGLASSVWSARVRETRLTFVDYYGKPMSGLAVTVSPEGDPLPGLGDVDASASLVTDAEGKIVFRPSNRTHVRLVLPEGLIPLGGALVPDACAQAEIHLPVRGRGSLVVHHRAGRVAPPVVVLRHLKERTAERWATEGALVPFGGLQVDQATTWIRKGTTVVGGREAALYTGWVRSFDDPTVVLVVPGEESFRFVVPKVAGTVEVDMAEDGPL